MDCKNISCCFSTSVDTTHRTVLLEITNRCNLACGYCHALGGRFTDLMLSEERLEQLFCEMRDNHITKVIFSGGEPLLLYPKLKKYVALAEQLGLECDICTNGTVMNDEICAWLKAHFTDITITLDTLDPDVYASMKRCSRSLFDKALQTIRRLIAEGLKVGITIVPTSDNYSTLSESVRYFAEIGVSAISILRLYRMEGAKDYLFDEEAFYRTVNEIVAPYDGIKFRLKGFGLQPESMGRCSAGEGMLGIGYDGRLYPCLLLRNPEWSCDLRQMTLKEAIESDANRQFLARRNQICKPDCPHQGECQYGCPAAAYIENGGFGCDIRCDYYK